MADTVEPAAPAETDWPTEAHVYATEREYNFRELASLFATTCPRTLTDAHLLDAPTPRLLPRPSESAFA